MDVASRSHGLVAAHFYPRIVVVIQQQTSKPCPNPHFNDWPRQSSPAQPRAFTNGPWASLALPNSRVYRRALASLALANPSLLLANLSLL